MLAWHNTCSSLSNFKKIGFPGWPDPNLDSVSGFGASIQKGACTSPLFYFWCVPRFLVLRPEQDPQPNLCGIKRARLTEWFDVASHINRRQGKMRLEKVSGRWGFRPLGRGDGGKRNPKLFLTSRHHAALASSTTAHRSRFDCPGSRDQLLITVAIVFPGGVPVDSSVVPFHPVLSASCFCTVLGVPSYPRL
jgi:hypothetical protein